MMLSVRLGSTWNARNQPLMLVPATPLEWFDGERPPWNAKWVARRNKYCTILWRFQLFLNAESLVSTIVSVISVRITLSKHRYCLWCNFPSLATSETEFSIHGVTRKLPDFVDTFSMESWEEMTGRGHNMCQNIDEERTWRRTSPPMTWTALF